MPAIGTAPQGLCKKIHESGKSEKAPELIFSPAEL